MKIGKICPQRIILEFDFKHGVVSSQCLGCSLLTTNLVTYDTNKVEFECGRYGYKVTLEKSVLKEEK